MNKIYLLKDSLSDHGGLEKYSWRIANAFADRDLPVTFLTSYDPKDRELPLNVSIQNLPLSAKRGRNRLIQFDRECFRIVSEKPRDIIFGLDRNRFQTHLRAGNGVHRAYLERRKEFDPFWKRLIHPLTPLNREILRIEKESFEHPNLRTLFTNSNMVRKEILKYYRTDPNRIQVVHNGVEWQEMQRDFQDWVGQKNRFALTHGLDPSSYQFLFIGNGYGRKGLKPLLKALSLLKRRDFHLSILGKEKRISEYESYAKKLNLEESVTFFGPRKEARSFYQFADCLVVPSYYDPFANVTVEALAMGLFVISSPYNGGSEIITKENGLILPNLSDPESFALALEVALDHPKTWIHSQEIRQSVKHLDFSSQLGKLVEMTLKTAP